MEQRVENAGAPAILTAAAGPFRRWLGLAASESRVMAFLVGQATRGSAYVSRWGEQRRHHGMGSAPRDVARPGVVLRRAMALAAMGLTIGLAAAMPDALTFAAASLLLVAVALLASYLKARRASRIEPLLSLGAD
jgi:hypothetical protein